MLTNLFTYDCPFIADANVFDYFWDSNFAGKCVIFALFGLSIYAWSLI